ncbi:MAG TPA: TetR family transcriptional regulator [Jiangellaceae bacterium]
MTSQARATTHSTAEALLDATERLLVTAGQAGVSTRRVAEEAGQPHGLIRYHFGSLEALMLQVLERASSRILERQRALYGGDRSFVEKWRQAMGYIETDLADGFPKITAELFAKAWNEPAFREGLRQTMAAFTDMLADAVAGAAQEYELDLSGDDVLAVATLIRTFQIGILVERLADIDIGHAELTAALDRALENHHPGELHARPAT